MLVLCLSNSNIKLPLIKLDSSYVCAAKWCSLFEFEHQCSYLIGRERPKLRVPWYCTFVVFTINNFCICPLSVCLFFDSQLTQSACFHLNKFEKEGIFFASHNLWYLVRRKLWIKCLKGSREFARLSKSIIFMTLQMTKTPPHPTLKNRLKLQELVTLHSQFCWDYCLKLPKNPLTTSIYSILWCIVKDVNLTFSFWKQKSLKKWILTLEEKFEVQINRKRVLR